jgi:voltage-gated potassium channel
MSNLIRFLLNHRSESLVLLFVGLVLLSPLGEADPRVGGLIALGILVLMLAGASYMASRNVVRKVVLPAAAFWLLARIVEALGDNRRVYTHLAPLAGLALSIVVFWAILIRLETLPMVSSGAIAEAFVGYLILATAFAQVYWIMIHMIDHPFNQVILPSQMSTLLYFSMITLTSLGYGGILPIDPYVRLVAAFEGMIGIFYIAVIVARLVVSYRRAAGTEERNSVGE